MPDLSKRRLTAEVVELCLGCPLNCSIKFFVLIYHDILCIVLVLNQIWTRFRFIYSDHVQSSQMTVTTMHKVISRLFTLN